MQLLSDMGHVELVLVYLEMVLVSVKDRCTVCAKCTTSSGIVLDRPEVLLGERLKWKLILVRMEIVLILTQDRCTVCTECTIIS
jgi:hypothetical protein